MTLPVVLAPETEELITGIESLLEQLRDQPDFATLQVEDVTTVRGRLYQIVAQTLAYEFFLPPSPEGPTITGNGTFSLIVHEAGVFAKLEDGRALHLDDPFTFHSYRLEGRPGSRVWETVTKLEPELRINQDQCILTIPSNPIVEVDDLMLEFSRQEARKLMEEVLPTFGHLVVYLQGGLKQSYNIWVEYNRRPGYERFIDPAYVGGRATIQDVLRFRFGEALAKSAVIVES